MKIDDLMKSLTTRSDDLHILIEVFGNIINTSVFSKVNCLWFTVLRLLCIKEEKMFSLCLFQDTPRLLFVVRRILLLTIVVLIVTLKNSGHLRSHLTKVEHMSCVW